MPTAVPYGKCPRKLTAKKIYDRVAVVRTTGQRPEAVCFLKSCGCWPKQEREPEKDLHRGSPDTTEQSARGKGGREYHEKRYGKDAPLFPIVEATKVGIAVGRYGDAINIAYPESNTRRGRVGKEIAQSLLTGCSQVVICDKKGGENDT